MNVKKLALKTAILMFETGSTSKEVLLNLSEFKLSAEDEMKIYFKAAQKARKTCHTKIGMVNTIK